jgi:hydrogenase expression/formation protein HypC
MCLSVPALVLRIEGDMAEVSVGGAVFRAGLQMVENVVVGDYILLHTGFAIQKLDERDAIETLELLKELNEAGNE